ncbi:hypothetical protein [Streptacidiphilus jiangxiensis]|uniref:hypothetical protein n=1 Tax=Streptacidiphilus jiangxiensis TaxID=235985 RepID=UPI001160448A|nr:hypothetical protein [Streptacidiphilus jiangxiensis]
MRHRTVIGAWKVDNPEAVVRVIRSELAAQGWSFGPVKPDSSGGESSEARRSGALVELADSPAVGITLAGNTPCLPGAALNTLLPLPLASSADGP